MQHISLHSVRNVVIAVIVIDAYVDIIIVIVVGPINVAAVRSKRSKCTQDKRTANAIAARQKMPNCPETATLNDKSKKQRTQPSAQLNTGLHLRVARPKHFPHHPDITARLRRVVAVMETWVPPWHRQVCVITVVSWLKKARHWIHFWLESPGLCDERPNLTKKEIQPTWPT